jgi:tRNA pseudouridine(55) synthase
MNVISPDDLVHGLVDRGILAIYKDVGQTPLQALDTLRLKYPPLNKVVLSYAGRLDPMAEGLMLVLVGETNKDRETYLGLNKVYEVEILLGIHTDTGDIFGIPQISSTHNSISQLDELAVKIKSNESEGYIKSFIGKQSFQYPFYSSKTVNGKPLHQWVNEGRISEIEIPKKDTEILSIDIVGTYMVTTEEILKKVDFAVQTVRGNFRFDEIKDSWEKLLHSGPHVLNFPIIKINCSCTSGTYMRTLAEEIGKRLGTLAFAYSIKRIKIGDISVSKNVLSLK